MDKKYLKLKAHINIIESPLIDFADDDWFLRQEPQDLYMREIILDIYLSDFNLENDKVKNKKVGVLSGIFIDLVSAEIYGENIADIFDSHSQETLDLYEAVFMDKENNDKMIGIGYNIFYIQSLYIENKYRNLGIGRETLHQLSLVIEYILKFEIGCIVVLPKLLVKEKDDTEIIEKEYKKLYQTIRKFFINSSFRSVSGTNYLYRNTEYKRSQ